MEGRNTREEERMQYTLERMRDFLRRSVSPFHAVEQICEILNQSGFAGLGEGERWRLHSGGKYYVTRNQSSVIAFTLPESGFAPVMGVASHSDSPCFRVKPCAEMESQGHYVMLDTERYGGMIMSTWLDRPLSVAGRLLVRTQRGLESRLVQVDRDMLLIPNLAIHMNREVNEKCSFNAQTDMMPLYGDASSKGSFLRCVAEAAGVNAQDVAGSDLYLYNRMAPSVWGQGDCYISAPRLDDLECAFTSLCAFTEARPVDRIRLYCAFDNEEVGSGTRQGADSSFLEDVLRRVAGALGVDGDALRACLASSFMVSADNAHAVHPNHGEKADPVNRPYMNEGPVIKFSANQKYTTDAVSHAIFSEICRRAGVPVQHYANRSDIAGGSTLGNISGTHVSVPTVDIGLAQLAMHSSYETAGTRDAEYMVQALKAFYETQLRLEGDGNYVLQ